jgi:uncharacterized protein (DUF1778 family)
MSIWESGMKKKRPGTRESKVQEPVIPGNLTTYSIRLGEPERALLTRALKTRGWTATHFIRQATLEKAAHIDNTSQFTEFDFDRLARRLAKQLCEPEPKYGWDDPESVLSDISNLQEAVPAMPGLYGTTEPPPLTTTDVERLRQAVHFGGAEFLRRILDECDRLVVHQRHDLPPPIDPAQFA